MRLIDAEKLRNIFFEKTKDKVDIITDEAVDIIWKVMAQHNLDYLWNDEVSECKIADFAEELLLTVCKVIDTQETINNRNNK